MGRNYWKNITDLENLLWQKTNFNGLDLLLIRVEVTGWWVSFKRGKTLGNQKLGGMVFSKICNQFGWLNRTRLSAFGIRKIKDIPRDEMIQRVPLTRLNE